MWQQHVESFNSEVEKFVADPAHQPLECTVQEDVQSDHSAKMQMTISMIPMAAADTIWYTVTGYFQVEADMTGMLSAALTSNPYIANFSMLGCDLVDIQVINYRCPYAGGFYCELTVKFVRHRDGTTILKDAIKLIAAPINTTL